MVHIITPRVYRGNYILPNVVLCFREVTCYNLGSETIAVLTEVFPIFFLCPSLHTNARLELRYATNASSRIICCLLFTSCPPSDATLPEIQNKPVNTVVFLPASFLIYLCSHSGHALGMTSVIQQIYCVLL
jgi:hypothetical protein